MHAILVSTGTDGDLFPYVGLGARLRARGHRVTLVANEHVRALAGARGLAFHALVSDAEMNEVLGNPDFWHPIKSGPVAARWGVRLVGRQYELLAGLARDQDAVLAASPGVVAARLVQDALRKPMATVVLQPGIISSVSSPPVMPGFNLPAGSPRWVRRLYWRMLDVVGYGLVGRHLNRIRAPLGLGPVRRFFQWWNSPDLVVGMFPAWYGPPQPDWPPQMKLTGFPMDDGGPAGALAPGVLEFCQAGEPPVAVTFGTGMMHASRLFRESLEACRTLGRRAILLTRHPGQLPASLPADVLHCEFAPFRALFPRCAAVIHHGGVGTVAKALEAGTPQLIVPMAFDQGDNAARVKRLGAGNWLSPKRARGERIARTLATLLTPRTMERCREAASRFGPDDALETAARLVEGLSRSGGETRSD
jgi:UDP:flavonoid glycosyltransferase YjiC (YdhE family)